MDRASLLSDAVSYINELKSKVDKLESQVQKEYKKWKVKIGDILDDQSITTSVEQTRQTFYTNTTSYSLNSLFSAFGKLDEVVVIHDRATGKSKGYGFVKFKHASSALLSRKEPSKKIDGRVNVTQFAFAGLATSFNSSNPNATDVSVSKIYVGNVPLCTATHGCL